jgi:hypothetical protein
MWIPRFSNVGSAIFLAISCRVRMEDFAGGSPAAAVDRRPDVLCQPGYPTGQSMPSYLQLEHGIHTIVGRR